MKTQATNRWNRMHQHITRWLPRLHHRALVTTLILYCFACAALNHAVKNTFEEGTALTEREHIEHIALFYHNNPLMDRYGLMADGHSLWEAAGQTFPALQHILLLDAQGTPIACFQKTQDNHTSNTFKAGVNCPHFLPPTSNTTSSTWEYHSDADILWQTMDTPIASPGWLRLEVSHTPNALPSTFLQPLLSTEAILGILLLGLVTLAAYHLERHINTLTHGLQLFAYSGFKDTARPPRHRFSSVVSTLEHVLYSVLDQVKKEISLLQQTETQLSDIVNHLPGAIIQHDAAGHCLFLSHPGIALLTGSATTPPQRPFIEYIHPDSIVDYQEQIQAVLEGRQDLAICRIVLRDNLRSLELQCVRHTDATGISNILAYIYDCTFLVQRELSLHQESLQYRQWLESLPLPLYVKNQLGQYLFFNPAWEQLTQIPRNQWIGKTAWDVFEPAQAQTLWDRERETLDKKITTVYESRVQNQAGYTRRALVYRTPILDNNNQPNSIIGLIVSLEGHVHHTDLKTRLEHIEQQDRQHTQMLAHLSNEVRTHLHSMLGLIDLMNEWLKTLALPHNNEYLGLIHSLAQGILNTTTDVNDILSFEQRTALPQPTLFNLETILIECARHFSPQAESKHLELIVNVDPSLPDQIEADAHLLRRALDPLIHNAIKFTPHGSIELSASLLRMEYEQVWIHFSVSDTGIGIPNEQQQLIFEPFVQGDAALCLQHHGGSGLGLTVFSRLMQHLGATYHIHSQQGQGTTFHFDWALPYFQPPPSKTLSILRHRTLFVVEGHARTTQIITQLANSWSMCVLVTRTAHQAIAILNNHTPTDRIIHAILIDGRLSDEDRSAPYRILEAAHAAGIQRRLIILPVNALFREHERYRHAHATATLLKPLYKKELLHALLDNPDTTSPTLDSILPTEHPPHALTTTSQQGNRPRTLLATHDPINRTLMEGWLEQLGHRCITISTSEELMNYYTSARFEAIFIDLDMTRPSGTDLLRLISLQHRILARNTPIIAMLSGKHSEYLIPDDAPVWAHIQKPVQLHILSTVLNSLPLPVSIPPQEDGTSSGDN